MGEDIPRPEDQNVDGQSPVDDQPHLETPGEVITPTSDLDVTQLGSIAAEGEGVSGEPETTAASEGAEESTANQPQVEVTEFSATQPGAIPESGVATAPEVPVEVETVAATESGDAEQSPAPEVPAIPDDGHDDHEGRIIEVGDAQEAADAELDERRGDPTERTEAEVDAGVNTETDPDKAFDAATAEAAAHESDTDGRWDEQKAATMAAIVQESGTVDHLLDTQQKDIRFLNATRRNADVQNELAVRKGRMPDDESFPHTNKTNEQLEAELNTVLPEFQAAQADAEHAAYYTDLDERIKVRGERITTQTDEFLSPYEELYDSNKDWFANMPTSEFMDMAERLITLDGTIDLFEAKYNELAKMTEVVGKSLEDGVDHTDGVVGQAELFIQHAQETLYDENLSDADMKALQLEIENGVQSAFEDSFNTTPKEKFTKLATAYRDVLAKVRDRITTLRERRNQMLGKEAEPQTSDESGEQPAVTDSSVETAEQQAEPEAPVATEEQPTEA